MEFENYRPTDLSGEVLEPLEKEKAGPLVLESSDSAIPGEAPIETMGNGNPMSYEKRFPTESFFMRSGRILAEAKSRATEFSSKVSESIMNSEFVKESWNTGLEIKEAIINAPGNFIEGAGRTYASLKENSSWIQERWEAGVNSVAERKIEKIEDVTAAEAAVAEDIATSEEATGAANDSVSDLGRNFSLEKVAGSRKAITEGVEKNVKTAAESTSLWKKALEFFSALIGKKAREAKIKKVEAEKGAESPQAQELKAKNDMAESLRAIQIEAANDNETTVESHEHTPRIVPELRDEGIEAAFARGAAAQATQEDSTRAA